MGNQTVAPPAEDMPWIRVIRDVSVLDYRRGLEEAQINTIRRKQSLLPAEILPDLYISSFREAQDIEILNILHVTHVINAAGRGGRGDATSYRKNNIKVLELNGYDLEGFPMLPRYFSAVRNFVRKARKTGGKVCIYCQAGLNRSGVLCAAEYMLHTQASVIETVKLLRKIRGNLCLSNHSFQEQLVALARKENLLGPIPPDLEKLTTLRDESCYFESFEESGETDDDDASLPFSFSSSVSSSYSSVPRGVSIPI